MLCQLANGPQGKSCVQPVVFQWNVICFRPLCVQLVVLMLLYPVRPATRLAGSSSFWSVYTKSLYVTGIFLPPQYQFALGLIVYDSEVFVAEPEEIRSLTYTPLLFWMKAPCCAST